MIYEEYYAIVRERFNNCIITNDDSLRSKILFSLESWYQKNYAEDAKEACEKNDDIALISISNDIEFICSKSDYLKVKLTYNDEAYNNSSKISKDIFSLVKESIDKNEFTLTKEEYDDIISKLKKYKQGVSRLYKDDYDYLFSESILDLDYLLNKGNVNSFSFRTSHYLDAFKK